MVKKRILVLIALFCIFAVAGNVSASGSFTYGPYLQNVTTDAITIMWVTDNMVTPSVVYSIDDSYTNEEFGTCIAESGVYICKVKLTGLDTETTYNYIAYSGTTAADSQTFTTAPYGKTPFGFCLWGDSQQQVTASNALFTDMANSDTDFGLAAGDIVQNPDWGYTQSPFLKYTLDKLARVKPVFIGYGNHDGGVGSIPRKFTEQPTTLNYTFTYGNAHFTVLDFADYGGGWVSYVPTAWVESALSSDEATSAAWRFVVVHVAPYSERWIDGSSVLRADLVPLLEQYDVDMVFSGHTHEYERGFKNDIYYIISGCGSYLDTSEPIVKDWDHMTVGGAQDIPPFIGGLAHGYAEIQINGNHLELNQHAYYPNGTYYGIIDTINITKTAGQCDFNFDSKLDYFDLDYVVNDWTKTVSADMYFGQDFNDVNNATPASPSYVGNLTTNSYPTTGLDANTTYYWRADEIYDSILHKGQTFQFTTGLNNTNIGWWKLDNAPTDSSGSNNDAILIGEIETKTDPQWNTCYYFDGDDDYIQIPNESQFDLTDNISIAAWVRIDNGQSGLSTIVSKGSSYWLYYDSYAEAVIFSCDAFGRYLKSATDIHDGQWHHVVATYNGSERAIYIDGTKDSSSSITTQMTTNDEPLTIANNPLDSVGNNFKGLIREVRIYSEKLPDAQILWLSKTTDHSPQPFNGSDSAGLDPQLKFYPAYWMQNQTTDLNQDKAVDFKDFAIFADQWLSNN